MPRRVLDPLGPTDEASLTKQILSAIRAAGWRAWRQNTGAARLPGKGGQMRLVRFSEKGVSDVLALIPRSGRLLAAEAKMPGAKLTPEQEQFLADVRSNGGVGVVIRDAREIGHVIRALETDPWCTVGGLD